MNNENVVSTETKPIFLPANLADLACLAATDFLSFSASAGIVLEVTSGFYRIQVTNQKIAAIVEGVPYHGEYPLQIETLRNSLATSPNGASAATIPAKEWRKAFKVAARKGGHGKKGNRGCSQLNYVGVVLSEQVSTLGTIDQQNSVTISQPKNIEGCFPCLDKVVPTNEPAVHIHVNAKLLAELLEVSAQFANNDRDYPIELAIHDGIIVVRAEKDDGQKFTGLAATLGSKYACQKCKHT